jgi:hypothetical protein
MINTKEWLLLILAIIVFAPLFTRFIMYLTERDLYKKAEEMNLKKQKVKRK